MANWLNSQLEIQARIGNARDSRIARQLIREMEQQSDVQHTSPVRKGIISVADAAAFIHSRKLAFQHIIARRPGW